MTFGELILWPNKHDKRRIWSWQKIKNSIRMIELSVEERKREEEKKYFLSSTTNIPSLKILREQNYLKKHFTNLDSYLLHCCAIDDTDTVKYLIEVKQTNLYSMLTKPTITMPYVPLFHLPVQVANHFGATNTENYLSTLQFEIFLNNKTKFSKKRPKESEEEKGSVEFYVKVDVSNFDEVHPSKFYIVNMKAPLSAQFAVLLGHLEDLLHLDLNSFDFCFPKPHSPEILHWIELDSLLSQEEIKNNVGGNLIFFIIFLKYRVC